MLSNSLCLRHWNCSMFSRIDSVAISSLEASKNHVTRRLLKAFTIQGAGAWPVRCTCPTFFLKSSWTSSVGNLLDSLRSLRNYCPRRSGPATVSKTPTSNNADGLKTSRTPPRLRRLSNKLIRFELRKNVFNVFKLRSFAHIHCESIPAWHTRLHNCQSGSQHETPFCATAPTQSRGIHRRELLRCFSHRLKTRCFTAMQQVRERIERLHQARLHCQ